MTDIALGDALRNRRWWSRSEPFPHVIASDVFVEPVHRAIRAAVRRLLAQPGRTSYLDRHDIIGITITPELARHLRLFVSRAWHDMLARLLGASATGYVNCGIHFHAPGSANGFVHNDLNPGWFVDQPELEGITLAQPGVCSYTSGRLAGAAAARGRRREMVRSAVMIYYVDNPGWRPGDGGETGLYRSGADPIDAPVYTVPPTDNSLLAFACTPSSYHGFLQNRRSARTSVIMWLHQTKSEATARWGADAIVRYRGT